MTMTPRPRHASQRDANQQDIVDDMRDRGYFVFDISAWCPWADIITYGLDTRTNEDEIRIFEIKTPDGKLTPTERDFQRDHPGMVQTVRCLGDCLCSYGRV